ncbi:MAG: DUF4249 domain-containing protein [Muribaculaceae bacterium]|nr:DUF4249 domain-containing protein [Muribaculaceae bacterium]
MAILKNLLSLCLPAMMLTGCYTDFNPDDYSTPVLCINSTITAGEPIEVSVSRTWRYNEPLDSTEQKEEDARVSIYINGELQEGGYVAKEGDEIRIVAESAEYGKAESSVKVPYAVPIDKVEFVPYGVRVLEWNNDEYSDQEEYSVYVGFDFEVRLRITDRYPGREWFRLGGDTYALGWPDEDQDVEDDIEWPYRSHASLRLGELDYNSDMIFKEHIGIAESVMGGYETLGMFFTDHAFSGSDYTVCLRFDGASFEASGEEFEAALLDCGVTFRLMAISESYYNRLNYLWQKNSGIIGDLADIGLSDPIWGYSNVSTGAGVVVAKSVTTYDLDFHDFLKQAIDGAPK